MANVRQNAGYIMLCKAIKKKDRVLAELLIQKKVNVNISNAKDNTPLHRAIIQFEDLHIIKMLLDRGANVHAENKHNLKPLEVAIQNNKTKAAILLMKKGALFGEDLNALLLKAIENYNHIIFMHLINYGLQHNTSIDFNILFNAAISQGQAKIIEYILPHCQFLETSNRYIPKKLVINSGQQYKECIELLLKWNFIINPTSNQDNDFVYGVVKNGDLQTFLQLLNLGIDVNLVNSKTGLNLLKIACFNKHHAIVENLLEHSASVNEITPTNTKILDDPLYYYHNQNGFIATLSSTYNMKDLWGLTCLHIAVLNSDPVMTRLLLRYGAKIIDDPKFYKITSIAVKINCEEIVRIFLDHGVDENDIDFQGKTLLHFCVHSDFCKQDPRYNIAKLLLKREVITHIQAPGNSLVFEAIINGHPKTAQLFLDFNANIQYINPKGDTLLHKAIEKDYGVEFIKTLLKLNAPVDAVNNYLLTPLLVTVKIKLENQFEIMKALLDHNANVNCTIDCANINSTDDILMKPINPRDLNLELIDCTISLERGFYFDSKKNKGKTPLHFVCKHKSDMTESIIKLLLQHNANIEAVDARGWTPLFDACYSHNDVAIKCLLDHGANANHIDSENVTPLYVAVNRGGWDPKIIEMLFERKVNLNCIDKEGKSMMHIFVENCNAEIIKSLIHTQLNFNSVDKEGNTPLHHSVRYERVDMIKSLVKYGANVNVLDNKNRTPLRNAIKYMTEFQDHFDKFQRRRFSRKKYSEDEDWDTDGFEDHINAYKKIIPIFKIQIVKLKTVGLKVNKQNLKIVYNSDDNNSDRDDIDCKIDILQLEVNCEQEIEKMRMENIINNMTFYDLLKKNIHYLSRYVKNKKIHQTLEQEVYDEKYPLYIDIIRSRFRDARLRYKLLKPAKKYFSLNINTKLPDNCVDTVFSYFNIKDINMFLRAVKLLD